MKLTIPISSLFAMRLHHIRYFQCDSDVRERCTAKIRPATLAVYWPYTIVLNVVRHCRSSFSLLGESNAIDTRLRVFVI